MMRRGLCSRTLWMLVLVLMVLPITGCPLPEDTDPTIVSMTINPNTIAVSSTGMTDEFFTVTITTANFASTITTATVFIQDADGGNRDGTPETTTINGEVVTLNKIPLSWFSGLSAGSYRLGAQIATQDNAESVTQLDLATVTVTE